MTPELIRFELVMQDGSVFDVRESIVDLSPRSRQQIIEDMMAIEQPGKGYVRVTLIYMAM